MPQNSTETTPLRWNASASMYEKYAMDSTNDTCENTDESGFTSRRTGSMLAPPCAPKPSSPRRAPLAAEPARTALMDA